MSPSQTKRERRNSEYTEDGVPKDSKLWTVEDWIDLHECMEEAKRRIRERHEKLRGEYDGA